MATTSKQPNNLDHQARSVDLRDHRLLESWLDAEQLEFPPDLYNVLSCSSIDRPVDQPDRF